MAHQSPSRRLFLIRYHIQLALAALRNTQVIQFDIAHQRLIVDIVILWHELTTQINRFYYFNGLASLYPNGTYPQWFP